MTRGAFYGIDVSPDGSVIVARHSSQTASQVAMYPGTQASYQKIQDEIRASGGEPHVCIRSGTGTLALAQTLTGVRGIRLTMVPAAAIDPSANREEVARFLAGLALELA